jgi:hypothetical protein
MEALRYFKHCSVTFLCNLSLVVLMVVDWWEKDVKVYFCNGTVPSKKSSHLVLFWGKMVLLSCEYSLKNNGDCFTVSILICSPLDFYMEAYDF